MSNKEQWLSPDGLDLLLAELRTRMDSLYAPMGYGLATGAATMPGGDCNNALATGWYFVTGGTLNKPLLGNTYGLIRVTCRAAQCVWQEYFDTNPMYTGPILQRCLSGTEWSEWEWITPPMLLDVEYRTTERYLGKPVYAKLISFGAMPDTTYKTINHGIADVERCIYAGGTCGVFNLQGLKGVNAVNCGNTIIGIGTDDDTWTSYEAQVLMKYTKTTD